VPQRIGLESAEITCLLLQAAISAGAELGAHRQTFDRRGEARGREGDAPFWNAGTSSRSVCPADAISRRVFDKAA